MSGTQFLSMLRECSVSSRSETRISFLYYIGSFAVWRGVEYGLVHTISACTGRVRRQFKKCGYRCQYSKSAYAPLCRQSYARWVTNRGARCCSKAMDSGADRLWQFQIWWCGAWWCWTARLHIRQCEDGVSGQVTVSGFRPRKGAGAVGDVAK